MLFDVAPQTNYHSIDNLSNLEMKFSNLLDLRYSLDVASKRPRPNPLLLAQGLETLSEGKKDVTGCLEIVMTDILAHGQQCADPECLSRTRSGKSVS